MNHLRELIEGSDTWTPRRRDEFVGSLKTKPGLRRYLRRTKTGLLRIDAAAIKTEAGLDGKWLLRTSDTTLTPDDLAAAYKQLLAVERGWRDMKGALKLRPVFHHREDRIRAHVQLCWLALLLIRVVETATGDTWRNLAHELDRMHLVTLATDHGTSPNAPPSPPGNERSSPRSNCPNRPGSSTSPPPTRNRRAPANRGAVVTRPSPRSIRHSRRSTCLSAHSCAHHLRKSGQIPLCSSLPSTQCRAGPRPPRYFVDAGGSRPASPDSSSSTNRMRNELGTRSHPGCQLSRRRSVASNAATSATADPASSTTRGRPRSAQVASAGTAQSFASDMRPAANKQVVWRSLARSSAFGRD